MLDILDVGVVDDIGLRHMQDAMAMTEPIKQAFGEQYYVELRDLLDRVEKLPVKIQYIHPSNPTGVVLWAISSVIGWLVIGELVFQQLAQ